jgi:hypothetical protein
LWRGIKKVLTSKWFVIALTIAVAVLTIGAAAGWWSLAKTVFASLGPNGLGGEILIAAGKSATTLGWVSSGMTAALAVTSISFSAKAILTNVAAFAAGIGISRVLSMIPAGPIGPGGTPPFLFQAIEQALSPAQGSLVWNMIELARKALQRKECRNYVGEGAYNGLRKLWDSRRITYFPGVEFRAGGGRTWAAMGPGPGWFSRKRMVLGHAFFDDREVDSDAAYFGISRDQARALTLLHEVRHYLGSGYVENHENGDWDKDIVKNCFK